MRDRRGESEHEYRQNKEVERRIPASVMSVRLSFSGHEHSPNRTAANKVKV